MTGLWRRCIWEVLSRGGGGLTSEGPWQSTLGRSWSGSGFSVSVGTNHQKSETSLGGHGGLGSSEPLTTVTATIRTWRYVKCRLCLTLGGLLHAKQMVKSLSLIASQPSLLQTCHAKLFPVYIRVVIKTLWIREYVRNLYLPWLVVQFWLLIWPRTRRGNWRQTWGVMKANKLALIQTGLKNLWTCLS